MTPIIGGRGKRLILRLHEPLKGGLASEEASGVSVACPLGRLSRGSGGGQWAWRLGVAWVLGVRCCDWECAAAMKSKKRPDA